jgi:hypothetical protein
MEAKRPPGYPSGYSSQEWLELRDKIVARDGHRCRNCGAHDGLEVHHWLPLPEFQDDVDHLGYAKNGEPLIVHESGLVTLCKECHASLTSIRTQRAVLRNPRLQKLGRGAEQEQFNVFQLWALDGEKLPFRVKKASWSDKVEQYYLVERIEITWRRSRLPELTDGLASRPPYSQVENGHQGELDLVLRSPVGRWRKTTKNNCIGDRSLIQPSALSAGTYNRGTCSGHWSS